MIVLHNQSSASAPQRVIHVGNIAQIAGPLVAEAIKRTIHKSGRCRLGLCGGSTPAATYAWLREHLPDDAYRQLWVTWVDERALPGTPTQPGDWQAFHEDTNIHLAAEQWLAHVPIPPHQVLPMTLGGDAASECLRFGRSFQQEWNGELDIAILGAGPDGHIASLFPDHPALDVDDLCLAVHDSPKPPAERISLALSVLQKAPVVIVLAQGKSKADMLLRAANGDVSLPLARLDHPKDLHWILDFAAASEILTAAQKD